MKPNTKDYITKEEFLSTFDYHIEQGTKFIAVAVAGATPEEELIINPNENFETKRAYYDKAYNDIMQLNAAPHIHITYIAGWNNLTYYEEDKN